MLTAAEVLALARDLESDRVERKRAASSMRLLQEVVCAFANDMPHHRAPGYLLVGIEDDGRLAGLKVTDQLLLKLAGLRDNGHILPLPDLKVYRVEVEPDADVAVVEVSPHPQPPVRCDGRAWIRIGPRQAVATLDDEHVLTERRYHGSRAWDEWLSTGAKVDDLRMDFIRKDYIPRRIAPEILSVCKRSDIDLLDTLRLWYRGVTHEGPTHGAMLLFSHRPRHYYGGLWTQFVRFEGEHRATKVLDDQEYDGDIFSQLRCLEKIDQHNRTVTLPDGREVLEYPAEAIREMVINAIMHRDYSQVSPVLFYWFSNRIEVLNAGGLMQGVSPEVFSRHEPPPDWHGRRTAYRNEAISEAMKTYGYVQKFGTGIPKIRNSLAANGSPYAEFRWNRTEFQATIYSVTQPKFETDEEKIAWLLQKEGNEEMGPILGRLEAKAEQLKHKAEAAAQQVEKERQAREAAEAEARAKAQQTEEAERKARDADARAEAAERKASEAEAESAKQALVAMRSNLYAIFDARGLPMPEVLRNRIEQCEDVEQLSAWIRRAVTASAAEDAIAP